MNPNDLEESMKCKRRFRVIVEELDENGFPISIERYEADNCAWSHQIGLCRKINPGKFTGNLVPNGQSRFELKAWKGCESFETFQEETTAYV